jgi:hypothetical protein
MPWEGNRFPDALAIGSFEEISGLAQSAARRPDYSFDSDEVAGYAHLLGPPLADTAWMSETDQSYGA